jgi:hypothetical protein
MALLASGNPLDAEDGWCDMKWIAVLLWFAPCSDWCCRPAEVPAYSQGEFADERLCLRAAEQWALDQSRESPKI